MLYFLMLIVQVKRERGFINSKLFKEYTGCAGILTGNIICLLKGFSCSSGKIAKISNRCGNDIEGRQENRGLFTNYNNCRVPAAKIYKKKPLSYTTNYSAAKR